MKDNVMKWKLWLDDQMKDPETPMRHTPHGFVGAASSKEAIALVESFGPPEHMDLDHDLGIDDDCLVFLNWLSLTIDKPPTYTVHSKNPVGVKRIDSFMKSWFKSSLIWENGHED